jgi:hypothetical protein
MPDSIQRALHDLMAFVAAWEQFPESQKITKKFLRGTMTMAQYNQARQQYGERLRVILEEDVPNHEPPSAAVKPDASPAVPEATATPPLEIPPGTPTDDEAKAALRREVQAWGGIPDKEIDYILDHQPLDRARTLLWKSRLRTEEPALVS